MSADAHVVDTASAAAADEQPTLLTLFTAATLEKASPRHPLRVLVVGDGDLSYAMVLTESLKADIKGGCDTYPLRSRPSLFTAANGIICESGCIKEMEPDGNVPTWNAVFNTVAPTEQHIHVVDEVNDYRVGADVARINVSACN